MQSKNTTVTCTHVEICSSACCYKDTQNCLATHLERQVLVLLGQTVQPALLDLANNGLWQSRDDCN